MNLYIPEVRDKLTLAQDLTATLDFKERTNLRLGAAFGYTPIYPFGWVKTTDVLPSPKIPYIEWPKIKDFEKKKLFGFRTVIDGYDDAVKKASQNPEYQEYLKEKKEWEDKMFALGTQSIQITLPAGTVLTVLTIYIRRWHKKGANSTVSFYVGLGTSNPTLKMSLTDVNKIQFT
jgi:hypothetical protein